MSALRSAIVTGASSGIGRAIAMALASSGWRVGLVGRNAARLAEAASACGPDAVMAALDMGDAEGFTAFLEAFGPIDLFVANHGILDGRRPGDVVETAEAAAEVLRVNLLSTINAIHAVLGPMRARGSGQIALVTSLAGLSPLADAPAYSASKAGLISYGLALREALKDSGVGLSVCCPGYVATAMGGQHLGNRPHEISAQDAAQRILKGALANRRLFGFPAPLWPMALFSLLVPERLLRLVSGRLRFTVADIHP